MKGDKAAADHEGRQMKGDAFRNFGDRATQSLRSKNSYSFQLSGERRETNEGRSSQEQTRMQGDK